MQKTRVYYDDAFGVQSERYDRMRLRTVLPYQIEREDLAHLAFNDFVVRELARRRLHGFDARIKAVRTYQPRRLRVGVDVWKRDVGDFDVLLNHYVLPFLLERIVQLEVVVRSIRIVQSTRRFERRHHRRATRCFNRYTR